MAAPWTAPVLPSELAMLWPSRNRELGCLASRRGGGDSLRPLLRVARPHGVSPCCVLAVCAERIPQNRGLRVCMQGVTNRHKLAGIEQRYGSLIKLS
jgi:hypothetical protein